MTLLGHAHTAALSKGSALDVPAPASVWGGLDTPLAEKLGGKSQPSTRHCKRKRREAALVSPRSGARDGSAAGADTKGFSDPAARVPGELFFFKQLLG